MSPLVRLVARRIAFHDKHLLSGLDLCEFKTQRSRPLNKAPRVTIIPPVWFRIMYFLTLGLLLPRKLLGPHPSQTRESMRLVSQEGMEAWQKKLNEVLRMGNGFANAGPIPHDVVQAGQAAIDAYKSKRAEDKPSNAQWVYDQALLQQHAYMNDTITSAD